MNTSVFFDQVLLFLLAQSPKYRSPGLIFQDPFLSKGSRLDFQQGSFSLELSPGPFSCHQKRGPRVSFFVSFQYCRPPTPLVASVTSLAGSLGRSDRVAVPANHISELAISDSSFARPCW